MTDVSAEHRFLFDLQGFILLRGVLSDAQCATLRDTVLALEQEEYDDSNWMAALPDGASGKPTREVTGDGVQVRLNGLPRLHHAFDELIDHPTVLPYLKAFMGDPQLINTWSISKRRGTPAGFWHRGVPVTDYSFYNGTIRTRMLNTVWFLTDNGADDGCVGCLPATHKSNLDLDWNAGSRLEVPGIAAATGRAGDVLLFSEAVIHNGLPKTTGGIRTNLYFNYVHAHYNVMTREPTNCHHFYWPPHVRARLTPSQHTMTRWMEHTRYDF